jgi:hypothetical protein
MENYDTMVDALSTLKQQGYTEDFNLDKDCLACRQGLFRVNPDEFQIDKFFRFEGASNPDDSSILYAISSEEYGIKGTLVNAYGIYSDATTDAMLKKLSV